jgi:hypothetical protein
MGDNQHRVLLEYLHFKQRSGPCYIVTGWYVSMGFNKPEAGPDKAY